MSFTSERLHELLNLLNRQSLNTPKTDINGPQNMILNQLLEQLLFSNTQGVLNGNSNGLGLLSELLSSKTQSVKSVPTSSGLPKACDCSRVETLLTQLLAQMQPVKELTRLEKLLATSSISPLLKCELNKLTIEELEHVNDILTEYIDGPVEKSSTFTSEQIGVMMDYFIHCFNKSMTHEVMHNYIMVGLSLVSQDLNRNKAFATSLCLFMNLPEIQKPISNTTASTTASEPSSLETALKNNPQVIDLIANMVSKSTGIQVPVDTKSKEDLLSGLVQGMSIFTSSGDGKLSDVMNALQRSLSNTAKEASKPTATEKMADSVLDEFIKTDSQTPAY